MSADAKNGCPHCGQPVFREQGAKLKARTSMLVIHKSTGGTEPEVEINCGSCGRGVIIPLVPAEGDRELRKAAMPRLVVPKT